MLGPLRPPLVHGPAPQRMQSLDHGLDHHIPGLGSGPRPLLGAVAGLNALGMLWASGQGGVAGNGLAPLAPSAATPLRRIGGPSFPLEGIKAAGFLDKRHYPV